MISLQLFLKEKFPILYKRLRNSFFPLIDYYRSKKRATFNSSENKQVSPLGLPFTVALNPKNGFIDQHIFTTGNYEPDILKVMAEYLKNGDTFVDIGGNIGWHSLVAASIVGPTGHIHTFEPLKNLRDQFSESLNLSGFAGRVTVYPFGCSDKVEVAHLHLNPINIGGSSIFDERHTETININLITADSALEKTPEVNLIKIDTEGYELEVLRGLKQTLLNKRPVLIIEYSPSFWSSDRPERSSEFFEILVSNNYICLDLENGHSKINDPDAWIQSFTKLQTNLLCLPQ